MKSLRSDAIEAALFQALYKDELGAVKFLSRYANIHARRFAKNNALHEAASYGYDTIIKFLLSHKVHPNVINDWGETPLHFAVRNKKTKSALLLITKKNVNIANNKDGYTPLHLLCNGSKDINILLALLEHGAKVNATNNNKNTPLHLACSGKLNFKFIEILLKNGANINAINNDCIKAWELIQNEENKAKVLSLALVAANK